MGTLWDIFAAGSKAAQPELPKAERELRLAAQDTLRDWASLETSYQGGLGFEIGRPPLDLICEWSGGGYAVLILSAPDSFGRALALASTGDPSAQALAREAMMAFTRMILERLALSLFVHDLEMGEATQARLAPRASWPQRKPDAGAMLVAGGHPVELRLWLS